MADDITVTPGTGKTIAADEVSSKLHQRVKLSLGADGSATDALGGAGSVAAGVQRVTLASDDPAVAVLGSTSDAAAASTTIKAALRAIATALGTTALDLGSGTGGSRTLRFIRDTAQWIGGAGNVTSAVQRTTLAADDPAVAVLGGTSDAAVSAGATGSISAKLRSISRDIVANIVLAAGTNLIGKVDHSATGIGHGVKTVSSAGTDEALAGSTAAKMVTVQAQTDNTGFIAVGATGVDATIATGTGVLLAAGESITLRIDNLADVFIDSTVSGDGVRYTYET